MTTTSSTIIDDYDLPLLHEQHKPEEAPKRPGADGAFSVPTPDDNSLYTAGLPDRAKIIARMEMRAHEYINKVYPPMGTQRYAELKWALDRKRAMVEFYRERFYLESLLEEAHTLPAPKSPPKSTTSMVGYVPPRGRPQRGRPPTGGRKKRDRRVKRDDDSF